ncbi:hypothetical protein GCM10007094_35660 [Pseudovibrio japonicus]|uniref:TolC family protein n=1 Tax=Pseudovibrio japonicus TaxID=366534 RepID=A0ABQ3EJW8_9HYPH|nr:hypothetical protein [Pseudovibrio japonicus]GHB43116.1 hypothetical protein GCM10007094_35660 [Pseudovibrio japonicus]
MLEWHNLRLKQNWALPLACAVVLSAAAPSSSASTFRDAVEDHFLFTNAQTTESWEYAKLEEQNQHCLEVLEAYLDLYQKTRVFYLYGTYTTQLETLLAHLKSNSQEIAPEIVSQAEDLQDQTLVSMKELRVLIQNELFVAHARYAALTGKRASHLQPVLTPSVLNGSRPAREDASPSNLFQLALAGHKKLQFQAARRARAYEAARRETLAAPAQFAQVLTALDELRKAELALFTSETTLVQLYYQEKFQHTNALRHLGLSVRLLEKKKQSQLDLLAQQHTQ